MNFFLHRTQSNVDVDDDTEKEDSLIPIDGDNQLEGEEQTGSELSINIERASKKCRKDFNKFQKGDKEGVDKILTFLKDKNDKKQAGELDFFFASACESTKHLPHHLQLKVKVEVMKAVINAETECLDHEQFQVLHPPSTVKWLVVVQEHHLHLLILKHQHLHLLRCSTHQLVKIRRKKILQTQRTEMQDCSTVQLTFINYSNPCVIFGQCVT